MFLKTISGHRRNRETAPPAAPLIKSALSVSSGLWTDGLQRGVARKLTATQTRLSPHRQRRPPPQRCAAPCPTSPTTNHIRGRDRLRRHSGPAPVCLAPAAVEKDATTTASHPGATHSHKRYRLGRGGVCSCGRGSVCGLCCGGGGRSAFPWVAPSSSSTLAPANGVTPRRRRPLTDVPSSARAGAAPKRGQPDLHRS